MSTIARSRLAGAWTRLSDKDGSPMGRLHATRRVDGALSKEALCGYRIPARALRARPFPAFSPYDPKACLLCVIESEDER